MSVAVKQRGRPFVMRMVHLVLTLSLFVAANWLLSKYLGGHLNLVATYPFDWFYWLYLHRGNISTLLIQTAIAGSLMNLAMAAWWRLGRKYFGRKAKPIVDLHGSARWANANEIKDMGLIDQAHGIYVGAWRDSKGVDHYLQHDGPEHALAFAPTRSGKGVSLVLPTLLSWTESAVIYDPKGEAWAITSGWRKKHANQRVLRFDPTSNDAGLATFNPLQEVRLNTPDEVGDVQNIANILVDPDGKGLIDHWAKTAHALLSGVILHCCYAVREKHGRPANLADVAECFSDPDRPPHRLFEEMKSYRHTSQGVHPMVAQEATAMLNKEDRELSSVLSTATSFLTIYRDPVIAKNVACSTFAISDLMNADRPVSLYLVVTPDSAERLRPLTRLMITQITRRLTGKMAFKDGRSNPHYKHRLLLLLDEFASLKRLPVIEEALSYMAGYGIKAYLIVQDLNQLLAQYGRDEALVGNCHVRVAFAPNKIETAELVSKMSGVSTIIKEEVSHSGKRDQLSLDNINYSYREVQRPLITADEAMQLKGAVKASGADILEPGDLLIFVAGSKPIYGKQILYFKDPMFSARSQIEPPTESDVLRTDGPLVQQIGPDGTD